MNKLDMPPMEFIHVESSQITDIAYDPGTQIMRVKFAPRKDGTQAVYQYERIDVATHAALIGSQSLYGYFSKVIKADPARFPYRKLD